MHSRIKLSNLTTAHSELQLLVNELLNKISSKTNQIDVDSITRKLKNSFENLLKMNVIEAVASFNETLQDHIKVQESEAKGYNQAIEDSKKKLYTVIKMLKTSLGYEFVEAVGFVRIRTQPLNNKYVLNLIFF